MEKQTVRTAGKDRKQVRAEVENRELFRWLQGQLQRENRRRRAQGRETVSYCIKMSGG